MITIANIKQEDFMPISCLSINSEITFNPNIQATRDPHFLQRLSSLPLADTVSIDKKEQYLHTSKQYFANPVFRDAVATNLLNHPVYGIYGSLSFLARMKLMVVQGEGNIKTGDSVCFSNYYPATLHDDYSHPLNACAKIEQGMILQEVAFDKVMLVIKEDGTREVGAGKPEDTEILKMPITNFYRSDFKRINDNASYLWELEGAEHTFMALLLDSGYDETGQEVGYSQLDLVCPVVENLEGKKFEIKSLLDIKGEVQRPHFPTSQILDIDLKNKLIYFHYKKKFLTDEILWEDEFLTN